MLVVTSLLAQVTERGREMSVSCVHGDTKRYLTVQANIVTPQGSCQMMVGAEPELPVGYIEESHSTWCSSIVLDGSLWFCNDFRGVNNISLFDAYPIPRVD